MQWTPDQQRAIQHGEGLLAVVAGAGSGKTGVLTERFIHLVVHQGIDPERILTITFTRTATAEMKTRIIQKLEQCGLQEARQRIESAYIHTVHALCRRLLQENPFEAGVEPEPVVLPTPAARQLSREAFHSALDHLLSQPETEITAALRELIGNYLNLRGARGDPLQSLYEMLDRLVTTARHQGLNQQAFEAWRDALPTDPMPIIIALLLEEVGLAEQGQDVHATVAWASCPFSTRAGRPCYGLADEQDARATSGLGVSPKQAHEQDARTPIRRGEGDEVYNHLEGEANSQEQLKKLMEWFNHLARDHPERKNTLLSLVSQLYRVELEKERQALQMSRALLALACEYLKQYESLKAQYGVLDFDDMQIRALEMLHNSATVRHRYQNLFQYVLVDETQDIDPLQAQIIELLAGRGNLMVVGDVQQSIYGFRHADPRVLLSWQADADAHPKGQLVRLQANFRSHPDILAFVDMVFRPHWGDSFLPLQPYRQPQLPSRLANVQVWYRTKPDYESEAELVAGTIRQWVVEETIAVHDPETDKVRPVRYGDCVLLFNQFTRVEVYERAFRKWVVPYFVVGGGRGYWLQYEVRDVANLMRALSDVENDLALLSLLRSPMVGLSVDGIMHIATISELHEMPVRIIVCDSGDVFELSEGDKKRLQQFQQWFVPLLKAVGTRSVGWILARALEATQYEAKLLSQPNGRQQVANVRKLLAIALQQPTISPQEFADQLDLMHRTEQREGHAPTYEENADVVRFYTVHGAKGLEFPVVFVVDTAFRRRPRTIPMELDPQRRLIGLELKTRDTGHPYESFAYWHLKNQHDQREHDESLRKLYVALTRARDYLIIALTHSQQNPWSLTLSGTLNTALNRRQREFKLPNGSIGTLTYLDT